MEINEQIWKQKTWRTRNRRHETVFLSSGAEDELVDVLSCDCHQICTCAFPTPCVSLNTLENLGIHFVIPRKTVQTWWNAIFRTFPPAVNCTCIHLQGGLSSSRTSWHIKLSSTMVARIWAAPGFLLSPILQHVRIANPRQNVLMTVRASIRFGEGLIAIRNPLIRWGISNPK